MSSKTWKCLLDIKGGRRNGIRESFLSLDLFSLTLENIFLTLLRGRSPPSPPMDPSLRVHQRREEPPKLHTWAAYFTCWRFCSDSSAMHRISLYSNTLVQFMSVFLGYVFCCWLTCSDYIPAGSGLRRW